MIKKKNNKPEETTENQEVEIHYKKIPLSQVVYVDIDDEVSSIYDRIKSKKSDPVYIVIPNKAVLFQSIVNVKILKRKAKDEGKEIMFITKDKSGVYFANKCNIPVFDNVSDNKKELTASEIPDNLLSEAQLKQEQSGEQLNTRPVKSDKKRRSIAEIIKTFRYKTLVEKLKTQFYKFIRKQNRKQQTRNLILSHPNRNLILTMTGGSIFVLFLIVYIALPSATLTIKPNALSIEQAVNITLAETDKNEGLLKSRPNRVIAAYKVNPGVLEKTITYEATGSDLDGANASGRLVIHNKASREFPLKPFTRFQTADGMIFRSQHFINVPAGNNGNPATVAIDVVADPVDVNNQVIGDRGNLAAGTQFFIPGIESIGKDLLYAENEEPLAGGITSKDRLVTQADIDASKEFAKAELVKEVPKLMEDYIKKINGERNVNLTLVNDNQIIQIGEPQIILDESIVGEKMPNFSVTARVDARAYAFDYKEFIDILTEQITLRKSPDKQISNLDQDGVTYRVFNFNEETGIIELTATIKGVERYDLSLDKEIGQKLIRKIKDHIAGQELGEAEKYIENLPEIESVEIHAWPFWAPTIPNMPENIKIEIDENPKK